MDFESCRTTRDAGNSAEVLFFFHGLGGNARSFEEKAEQIYAEWDKTGKIPPVVISFSFGGFWLLTEPNGSSKSGYLPIVVNEIMPNLLAHYGLQPEKTYVVGASMGGFNAAQLALRHPAKFDRIAMLCPAIATISPWASLIEAEQYVQRTGANRLMVLIAMDKGRQVFHNEQDWLDQDPLRLASTLLSPATPPLYMSCGDADEFGFFEGSELFARTAYDQGVQITWDPISGGGHCSYTLGILVDFFIKALRF